MKVLFALVFIILFSFVGFAQENPAATSQSDWVRIESPSKDLSLSFPPNYIVDNEDGTYRIYAFKDGVQLYVTMQTNKNARKEFGQGLKFLIDKKKYEFFKIGEDFLGMQYNDEDNLSGDYYKWLHFASANGSYIISVRSKNLTDSSDYAKFLYSIRINDKPFFVPKNGDSQSEQKRVLISSLKTDDVVLKALKEENGKQSKLEKADKQDKEKIIDTTNYSKALIILRKPRANYTDSARQSGTQGTVRLKVTFLATGQIGTVKVVSSLSPDLDRMSFDAAKKIKFLPAEVDGKPVDTTKFVAYSFTIY